MQKTTSGLGIMVTYDAQELHDSKLLIYLYSLRTAKSNIIFYISKKIHMIFFISLNKNYVLKLEFRKYFIDIYTTRLKIFFVKSHLAEKYETTYHISILLLKHQSVSE